MPLEPLAQPRKGRKGRPPAAETRARMQYTLRHSAYREVIEWHQSGALAKTLSGSIERIIMEWLEANRPMLPHVRQATAVERTLRRHMGRDSAVKAMRNRSAQNIHRRSRGFIDMSAVYSTVSGPTPSTLANDETAEIPEN